MSVATEIIGGNETEASEMVFLPYRFARDTGLAIDHVDGRIRLTMAPNARRDLIVEVARSWQGIGEVCEVSNSDFENLLSQIYASRGINDMQQDDDDVIDDFGSVLQGVEQSADLLASDDDAPIIRLLNSLLSEAVNAGASDIHLEPFENEIKVRLRVDGLLNEIAALSSKLAPYLVSRVKVMSRLDIAEKRVPQDGRLSLTLGGKAYDVRVSTLPIRYGERVVMRLLDKNSALVNLSELGMPQAMQINFQRSLREPNGILLVTGPTGSGKTTTLYSSLGILNEESRNIMTVEDPVEYALQGISQTQVNNKVGMTFASGLRSILRQDPDIVMVGEIRDIETAEIAIQASLTGHLVLSTVHTNSAAAAITRMIDMGVETFLLASSLKMVLAQRLVRRLCKVCRTPLDASADLTSIGIKPKKSDTVFAAAGCDACNGSGFRGRIGVYELLQVDDVVRRMVQDGASELNIEEYVFARQPNLTKSSRDLVLKGETTAEEIMRVARFDPEA